MWKGSLIADIGLPSHLTIQKEFLLSKFMGSEADAIEHANNTDYGLSATVWTEDIEKGKRVAKRLGEI